MWFIISSSIFVIFAITYLSWHFYQMLPAIKYKKTVSVIITFLIFLLNFIDLVVFGFIINLAIMFVVSDVISLLVYKFDKIKTYWVKIYLKGFFAIGISLLISVYGMYNAKNVVETDYDITINKEFTDKKIMLASDIHLGTTVKKEDLSKLVDKAKETKPDIIVLAGDVYDESTTKEEAYYSYKVFKELATLAPVYYIEGNHDVGYYGDGPIIEFEVVKNLTDVGVTVLQDKVVELDGMYLVGRKDAVREERKSVEELIKGLDKNKPIILLDHQPKGLKENSKLKIDFEMSGHTHGGQNFPSGQISVLFGMNEINYGYEKIDDYQIIVTSGMGTWGYSMRTSKNSEIVIINLHSKDR